MRGWPAVHQNGESIRATQEDGVTLPNVKNVDGESATGCYRERERERERETSVKTQNTVIATGLSLLFTVAPPACKVPLRGNGGGYGVRSERMSPQHYKLL